jgi:hypothetical protein
MEYCLIETRILPVRIVNKLSQLPSSVSYRGVAVSTALQERTAKCLPIYKELLDIRLTNVPDPLFPFRQMIQQ